MRELIDKVAADFWTARMSGLAEDVYRYLTATKTGAAHLTISPEALRKLSPKTGAAHLTISPEALRKLSQQAIGHRDVHVLPDAVAEVARVGASELRAASSAVSACWESGGDEVRALLEQALGEGLFNKSLTDVVEGAFSELDAWRVAPPREPAYALQGSAALQLCASALADHKNKRKRKAALPEHELFGLLEAVKELLDRHELTLETQAVALKPPGSTALLAAPSPTPRKGSCAMLAQALLYPRGRSTIGPRTPLEWEIRSQRLSGIEPSDRFCREAHIPRRRRPRARVPRPARRSGGPERTPPESRKNGSQPPT